MDTGKCSKEVQSIDMQRIPRSTKRVTPDSKSTISHKDIVTDKKQKAEKLMVKMDFNKSSKDSKCSDVGNREESYKRSRTNQISDQKRKSTVGLQGKDKSRKVHNDDGENISSSFSCNKQDEKINC